MTRPKLLAALAEMIAAAEHDVRAIADEPRAYSDATTVAATRHLEWLRACHAALAAPTPKIHPKGTAPDRIARGQVRLHLGRIPYVVVRVDGAKCWLQFETEDVPEDCDERFVRSDPLAEPWIDPAAT